MKIIKPSFYKDFKCIAGACPDSCCQGWEVDADSDSLAYYASLDSSLDIKKKIDSVLDKDEFGNTIFSLAPKKRCPFLNSENLCDMHIAIGAEHTPFTCRNFPRFTNNFGGTREMGVSFSCPVAADMMYALDKWEFDEEVNGELPLLNDIDPEQFIFLKKRRKEIIDILQNRALHIRERLISVLELCNDLIPDSEAVTDCKTGFFDVFINPELINPEWEEKVKNAKIKAVENTVFNENVAMYFIYKYFLASVLESDCDALCAVKMAAVGVLIATYIGSDAWTLHLWSKETEHSQYNMDRYLKLLKTSECLTVKNLIKLLKAEV